MPALRSAVLKIIERLDPHLLIIRVPMAAMFAESAFDKSMHFDLSVSQAAGQNIHFAPAAILAAILVEALGSVALLSQRILVPGLLTLAGYTLIVNLYFFDFWNMSDIASVIARKEFLKNVAVAAGLLSFLYLPAKSSPSWRGSGADFKSLSQSSPAESPPYDIDV